MNYAFLQQLLAAVEKFEAQDAAAQGAELTAFAHWLLAHTSLPPDQAAVMREAVNPVEFTETRISKHLTYLYRYARFYSRFALHGSPLVAFEDFTYLATVNALQPLSKTELIGRNIHEKSSGTEVIKRLLKQSLLSEQAHAVDRRSKMITLSAEGQQVLRQYFGRMRQESRMLAGNLDAVEREQLLYLLLKLDSFHYPIFRYSRAQTFEELTQRHFPDLDNPEQPPKERL